MVQKLASMDNFERERNEEESKDGVKVNFIKWERWKSKRRVSHGS